MSVGSSETFVPYCNSEYKFLRLLPVALTSPIAPGAVRRVASAIMITITPAKKHPTKINRALFGIKLTMFLFVVVPVFPIKSP